jgi:toxin-antitoxin system PIN domain toxin
MRALLDVNVVIALFDSNHVFHERAHEWWAANMKFGWASCPLTENGVVRIMSNPNYSQKVQLTPADLVERWRQFVSQTDHEFWPDNLSLRDEAIFAWERIHSSRQLTDLYLLALAVKNRGRLVTFDQGISLSSIHKAEAMNLSVA